jgi:hypothetical protein
LNFNNYLSLLKVILLYFNILGVLLCNGDTVVMSWVSAVLQFIFISFSSRCGGSNLFCCILAVLLSFEPLFDLSTFYLWRTYLCSEFEADCP